MKEKLVKRLARTPDLTVMSTELPPCRRLSCSVDVAAEPIRAELYDGEDLICHVIFTRMVSKCRAEKVMLHALKGATSYAAHQLKNRRRHQKLLTLTPDDELADTIERQKGEA